MRLALPRELAASTGETDPVHYYSRPLVGWLFRHRIEMGLEMIPPLAPDAKALEIGYGAGLVVHSLASTGAQLYGVDLDADPEPVRARLQSLGTVATLARGTVLDMQALYADEMFDLAVCFSVMEHIGDPGQALSEILRILKPGGTAIIGMPAVNPFMSRAFRAIGFKGIDRYHITTPRTVWRLLARDARVAKLKRRSLPPWVPLPWALYSAFRFEKAQPLP